MLAAFEEHYPALMADGAYDLSGTFEADAAADRAGDA
jgi:hypothetical protein